MQKYPGGARRDDNLGWASYEHFAITTALLAYSVARRTAEIGVRIALGATAGGVARLVLADALEIVCLGLAIGVGLVLWSRPLAASLVQDLKPESGGLVAAGCGAIFAVALLASFVPAWRAASVDPVVSLRHE